MLQQLGPTYVKIGQMMASRSDILPPEWIAELSKLQSEAAPFAYEDVVAIVTKELGAPPEALYATFDPMPFAAASTAQVHQATLHDGTLVAVKVQRPRIAGQDPGRPRRHPGAGRSSPSGGSRWPARSGCAAIVGEFAAGRPQGARLPQRGVPRPPAGGRDDRASREIHVPIVYDELSGQRVITMEFVNGIKISKADELREAGFDTTELGTVFIRAIIKQVLVDGFFHGDPHPGNILADPISKQIIFLDLGLVGQLDAPAAGRPPRA